MAEDGNYLSYSQLCDYLQCRYKWFLGYDFQGVGLETQTTGPALVTGSAVHTGLEALCHQQFFWDNRAILRPPSLSDANRAVRADVSLGYLTEDDIDKYAQIAWLAYQRMPWDKYKVASTDMVNGEPAVEVYVEMPLPGFDGFRGYVDLILQDRDTGALWLVDHKVRKQFASSRDIEPYIQLALYQHVLTEMGYKVAGTATHEIRSDLLDVWKVSDSGTLVRKSGRGNSSPIRFQRHYRSKQECAAIWNRVVLPAASDIALIQDAIDFKSPFKYDLEGYKWLVPRVMQPNICALCQFRELCFAGLKGDDTEFLLEELYQTKQR